jgi:hypothetical protein
MEKKYFFKIGVVKKFNENEMCAYENPTLFL